MNQHFQEDYLAGFATQIDAERIKQERLKRSPKLDQDYMAGSRACLDALPYFKTRYKDYNSASVGIGHPEELSNAEKKLFMAALDSFVPWKKGPFHLFGVDIDAEWRSDLKWGRLLPHIMPLTGRRVADIGCHNGYYMFRMLGQNPALVVGFDPFVKNFYNFQLMQRFAQEPALHYELLGVEHMHFYPNFFDTVFCLGILYHHREPIKLLEKIRTSMVAGGQLILECQGIPGDITDELHPERRYLNGRGIWSLPTASRLEQWVSSAGFLDGEIFFADALSVYEQRATEWAPIKSLRDFLDPNDATKTLEGYPAPVRIYMKAVKGVA